MVGEDVPQENLDRVENLSIVQIAAYVNLLNDRLRSDDCTDEARKNVLELLGQLTERVRVLRTISRQYFSELGAALATLRGKV
jgi:hypothetical protein